MQTKLTSLLFVKNMEIKIPAYSLKANKSADKMKVRTYKMFPRSAEQRIEEKEEEENLETE